MSKGLGLFEHSARPQLAQHAAHLRFDVRLTRGDFCLNMAAHWHAPCTVLLGPSGAGKSSLLMLLAGLYPPDHGYVYVADRCLTDTTRQQHVPPERRHMGLMWQDGQLFPHLNVEQNLTYGYRLLPAHQRPIAPALIIDLLDIGPLLKRQPRHLSGGEKQRVALGRTLLAAPHCLLLDEPLNALNAPLKRQILDFLKQVPQQLGIPLVLVTHQADDAVHLDAEVWHCQAGGLWMAEPLDHTASVKSDQAL